MRRAILRLWCFVVGFHPGLHLSDTCMTCGTTFRRARTGGKQ